MCPYTECESFTCEAKRPQERKQQLPDFNLSSVISMSDFCDKKLQDYKS